MTSSTNKKRGRPKGIKLKKTHHIGRSWYAKEIFRLFMKPIIGDFWVPHAMHDQENNELQRRIEMFFCKDTRHIWLVRCISAFKIVGPAWSSPDTPMKFFVDGSGQRDVSVGDYLWIRHDETRHNITEVEYKDQVFHMQTFDWEQLQHKCEEVG